MSYAAAAALSAQGAETPVPRRPVSLNPTGTVQAVALLSGFTVLLVGLCRYFARREQNRLVTAVVGLGVLVALIAIVQKALLGDDRWSGMKIYGFWAPQYKLTTPFGPFVNKNHYAGWMLMTIPLAVGYVIALAAAARVRPGLRERLLWLSSSGGGRLQLTAFAIMVMAASLVLTRSRSGIACFALTLVMAAYAAARAHRSTKGRLAILAGVAAVIALPLLWANVDLVTRFTSGGQSVELRRQAWRDARSIIRDFPLTGTGLNTYGTATLVYNTTKTDLHFQEAHNDYLQLAAEGGLLIGIPALVAILACVRGIRRRLEEDRGDPMRYWIRFGAATGLVAMALQSAVEFSLQMPGNAVLFVLLSAMALHESPVALNDDDSIPWERRRPLLASAEMTSVSGRDTPAHSAGTSFRPVSPLAFALALGRFAGWRLVPALGVALALALTEGAGLILLVPLLGSIGLLVGEGATRGIAAWMQKVFGLAGVAPSLPTVLAVFLGVSLLYATLYRLHLLLTPTLEQQFVLALRERLYAAIVSARWSFLVQRRMTDMQHALISDMERVSSSAYQLLTLVASSAVALIYIAVAARISPGLTATRVHRRSGHAVARARQEPSRRQSQRGGVRGEPPRVRDAERVARRPEDCQKHRG